ncbi:HTTM domain-containing protein [Pontibacter sp. G13]|uniref:HTTM domain-containing protein n=1 Tax=Pontibacter sp. G13 TaxID=3074898 RepID=UPI0028896B4C|nr:HTTM domain-containing protein [Pontibacter sp. G13]WNJ20696.1 HTTM domain-containing protein [Pontibacter sp. G13]
METKGISNLHSQGFMGRFQQWLEAPIHIAPLVVLRVLFGLLMLISSVRFLALGWVENHFADAAIHFKYVGFHWVEPFSVGGMYAVYGIMIAACVAIILGWHYRLAALLHACLFTYTELIDLTYYLNHYYFISIFSFLMVVVPAHRAFSLDVKRHPSWACTHVPRWTLLILQIQIAIVYVYAGLAKINSEWLLDAMPLRIWLPAHTDMPILGWTFAYPITAYLFSWAGMLYDTFIVIGLAWKPTRWLAYLAVLFFHGVTGYLFQIGMFPTIMITITLVFFSEEFHLRILHAWRSWFRVKQPAIQGRTYQTAPIWGNVLRGCLILHVVFQLVFPWRYLLYDGNLFWNEEGYRFSWRVMLMEKAGTATFYVKDTCTGREGVVDNAEFLKDHQEKQMAMQPDMILQFAHFLADHYESEGLCAPEVRAEVYVTLNGRRSKLLVDPEVDLTQVHDSWKQKEWVLPFQE